ncbi:MAG: ATP-binding protein [Actinomycetota bacterium]|nr:ATP-binding protein [Actinomycetota bacterium]
MIAPNEERAAPSPARDLEGPLAFTACVAVYDSLAAAPQIHDVSAADASDLIGALSGSAYALARDAGGPIPYTVIREIVENYIHADFQDTVVSIMEGGRVVTFSDHGPGIVDKATALRPGFSTATNDMRRYIRGVGSGLPIVNEFLSLNGGALDIEDNLGSGTVITLRAVSEKPTPGTGAATQNGPVLAGSLPSDFPRLTTRQKRVLSLVMEIGDVGPTLVSKELGVGLSTAYRDLAFLEERGLISSDEGGKRCLTLFGSEFLDALFG